MPLTDPRIELLRSPNSSSCRSSRLRRAFSMSACVRNERGDSSSQNCALFLASEWLAAAARRMP